MPNENTMKKTFTDNLNRLLQERGITQAELAAYMEVSNTTISNWVKGYKVPRMDKVDKLCSFFKIKRSELLEQPPASGDLPDLPNIFPIQTKKVPLLGTIAAGVPIYADENFDGYRECTEDIDADFCLKIQGDSMIGARINDGDIVFIKKQPDVDNGEIAAVLIEDEATLKRVYKEKDSLILQAENPKYAPIVYMAESYVECRIMGKAVAFQSDIV